MPIERKTLSRLKVLAAPACFGCQARERTEWASLRDDDLAVLETTKTCNVFEPGQIVFYEGNACLGIHCIESGSVALRRSDGRGGAIVSGLAGPGTTLGYLAYFGDRGHTATAEALEPSRICFLDRAALRALLDRNPAVGLAFLRRLASDLDRSEESRVQALALPLRARAAHLFLVLKDRSATVSEDGTITIDLPLSKRDLASMLGARPESLSRLIREFRDAGVADVRADRVVVPDLDALIDEVEADPASRA